MCCESEKLFYKIYRYYSGNVVIQRPYNGAGETGNLFLYSDIVKVWNANFVAEHNQQINRKEQKYEKTPFAYANAVLNYNLTTIFNIPYLRGEVRSVE